MPKVSWFPGFFNPQSFLTAVQQQTARKNEWPLDKTVVVTDVTPQVTDQHVSPAHPPPPTGGRVVRMVRTARVYGQTIQRTVQTEQMVRIS